MKFSYAASDYSLEFRRQKKQVSITRRDIAGNKFTVSRESRYPYTTVTLYESRLNMLPTPIYSATVGCLATDRYSPEQGRIHALRALYKKIKPISPELGKKIWEAYRNRKRVAPKPQQEQKAS